MDIIIAPSLLASDHAGFGEGAERAGHFGADCAHAGADTFVAGTDLCGACNLKSDVAHLQRNVSEAVAH